MSDIAGYIIPILYFYFAFVFLWKKPKYKDQSGFSTKRAKESEEIWDFVQVVAGRYCLAAALIILGFSFFAGVKMGEELPESLFWLRTAIEVGSIALIVPVVNLITNRRFPKN